jgi:hypothetical protein
LETRILEWINQDLLTNNNVRRANIQGEDAFKVHLLALTTFVDNWRWYFRYIGGKFNFEVCTYDLVNESSLTYV